MPWLQLLGPVRGHAFCHLGHAQLLREICGGLTASEGKLRGMSGNLHNRGYMQSKSSILFEPWNMGDAVMALAIALQDPTRLSLACNSKWHELLRCAAHGMDMPKFLSVDLGYISRNKDGYLKFGDLPKIYDNTTVLSIRGDVRDYYAAKKMFPNSQIRANGWLSFLAKRSTLIDFPFARGWAPVRNRYRAWALMANIKWADVERFYQQKGPLTTPRSVVIHVGAQWRSRQYPHVAELVENLKKTSNVQVVAGPGNLLPDGIRDSDVSRLVNYDLVNVLQSSSYVITNDSGPMHLAALLRCRTLVVTRQAAIQEWLPPTVVAVESKDAPKGYMPNSVHLSDRVSGGWPSSEEVIKSLDSYTVD
jgi:hypothetical protein